MKNNKIKILSLLTLVLVFFMGCEDNNNETFENNYIINDDINLTYTNLETYSYLGEIVSDVPSFKIDASVYSISILEINTSQGKLTNNADKFAIDPKVGVIAIDNEKGILIPGETYNFTVGVNNVNGVIKFENAYTVSVNQIPLDYTITSDAVNIGFLDEVDVATVTYTDTSGSNVIDATSVEYKLANAPDGFSINKDTGVISRNTSASSGVHKLSVTIATNVGQVTFDDVVTVTIGPAPTIEYSQSSGSNALTNVTLSPWTAYKTATPNLQGMDATGGYEVILPATLTAGSVIVNADGSLEILADQNLAEGTYSIGVNVTNGAGTTVPFEDLFTITVETRWEASPLFEDNFNDGADGSIDQGNAIYADYKGFTIGKSSKWQKKTVTKNGLPDLEGLRVFNPGATENYLVRSVDITGVKAMRVSFAEAFGYNDEFVTTYLRGFYAGESTADLEADTFNSANWTTIMASDDSRWLGSSNWQTRVTVSIPNIPIDLSNISGNDLKLAWSLNSNNGAAQNGQYFLDDIKAEISIAFPAEEN